eukprot:scaffold4535_cov138-Isochrysis_galbana.AAC.4
MPALPADLSTAWTTRHPFCCVARATTWHEICVRMNGARVRSKAALTPHEPCVSRATSSTCPSSSPMRPSASAAGSAESNACTTRELCAWHSRRTSDPRNASTIRACIRSTEASVRGQFVSHANELRVAETQHGVLQHPGPLGVGGEIEQLAPGDLVGAEAGCRRSEAYCRGSMPWPGWLRYTASPAHQPCRRRAAGAVASGTASAVGRGAAVRRRSGSAGAAAA